MRIVFFINDLSGGGAEKALKLLSGHLAGAGHEVSVVTLQASNDSYALESGVSRVTMRSGALGRGAGKVLALPVHAAELAAVLHRTRPDVCVSFLPRSNVAHVMTRWFGNRRPILLTEQISSRDNYPGTGIGDRVMRGLIARFHPRADAVFPSSAGVRDGLETFGVPRDRMHVVYNPISVDEIQRSAREPLADAGFGDVPTIITVGRYAPQKDHATLLRAFAIVRRQSPARLVLIGQGPLRAELEVLADELGIRSDVRFAGWQPNPFAWLARSDLFVLSSRYEGFGNVIVEAMACGLPVVSTDCPSGPREILRDGEAGELVPVGDPEALAAAMLAVLADPDRRARLAAQSAARAPEFDISVIGPRYAELLRSFAAVGRGAS